MIDKVAPTLVLLLAIPAVTSSPAAAGMDGAAAAMPPPLVPERTVSGPTVVSASDPAVRVTVPDAAVHIGAVRWPLYGVSDTELHLFVEADEARLVRRFYWIQFEEYLPSRPDARFDYQRINPETTTLSGRTVHVQAGFGPGSDHATRAGSDSEAFRTLVTGKGYRLPPAIATVRFVELFEPTHRKELMIIYGEDMRQTVDTIGKLADGGAGMIALADLHAPLIERAKSRITLEPNGSAPDARQQ